MLHTVHSATLGIPVKGSLGYILDEIEQRIAAGERCFSYTDMAVATGYSVPAVQRAVKALEHAKYIQVTWGGKGKPNQYVILSQERRRTRLVAQYVGLIQ